MSKPAETLFSVAFKQLAKDGKKAGADLPDVMLSYIPGKQLRSILDSLEVVAPTIQPPLEPELRITAPTGTFVVKAKGGKLQFVSWSSNQKGGEYSAARIFSIITGEEVVESSRAIDPSSRGGKDNKAVLALLLVAIIAVNAFTVWFVTKPKRTLLPSYTVMPTEPAQRLLEEVAGAYETGNTPGDRRLEIAKDGKVHRILFGADHAVRQKQEFSVKPAQVSGKPALLTSRQAMITIKDTVSVVLYGDTYRRVSR